MNQNGIGNYWGLCQRLGVCTTAWVTDVQLHSTRLWRTSKPMPGMIRYAYEGSCKFEVVCPHPEEYMGTIMTSKGPQRLHGFRVSHQAPQVVKSETDLPHGLKIGGSFLHQGRTWRVETSRCSAFCVSVGVRKSCSNSLAGQCTIQGRPLKET